MTAVKITVLKRTLHADLAKTLSNPGRRRFHLECAGRRLLEDFDVFAEAGGAYRPVVRECEAAAEKNGAIVLEFRKGAADYPKVSAIEIIPAAGGKPIHSINAGGPACGVFAADQYFTGGNTAEG